MNVFQQPWADAYQNAINASEAYRSASAKWEEGSIGLLMQRASGARVVLLDLWHGECRTANATSPEHAQETATFIISGDEAVWQQVLAGKLQPLMGIMTGKLKLSQGSMARLLPYAKAAAEMVACAQNVPTTFDTD